MKQKKYLIAAGAALATAGIAYFVLQAKKTIPAGVNAITDFDKEKYMGRWYEIARLDFYWEKGLDNVTADYSLNNNGTVKVVNSGYDVKNNKWKTSEGKAKFVGDETTGQLKVSFFGPFYSGYNIIAIDKEYKYALVAGHNLNYLWLLSREKTMPENITSEYLFIAQTAGFPIEDLVWTRQN